MRVTGGTLGGRRLSVPAGGKVRPTQDRVRQALFGGILAPRIAGCRFLDLFAGSGAAGIEALSRGATEAAWVEAHPRVRAGLKSNLAALKLETAGRTYGCDALAFLRRESAGPGWDIVFADPPYGWCVGAADPRRSGGGEAAGVLLLRLAAEKGHLAPGGVFVLETAADEPVPSTGCLCLYDQRRYGDTRLLFYSAQDS